MADENKGPVTFLRNVGREMKRVTWPTKKELTRYTLVVLTTLIFMVAFFYLVDLGISTLLRML
ncbi:preprotein translocase subunit SecE [Shouchella clausii]|jgi:preprotein translocase subunit SecE|uniref:Protein translocase subunit SecE n=3 Tax=Shouchella TaxID=2893057 RepID=Q5WLS7_SHOC1|nr:MULTISPECIES: preprotein translocase subunit SecE [Shouchella]MCM3314805.1 preprotein translocase subunit SecE [Psychrobacillus sp. MER TA 17]PAD42211.1 preprotein translocase subunit SecE [Bacillus sp. 7520-S]SPU18621.1 preprotein translocase subunit E [Niallia circulans]ALA52745.1 Preprotein translocase subunit SecE [Shouchella clausii]AST95514.1 preprotein translocase subunit SecE [Shouchella clausii]